MFYERVKRQETRQEGVREGDPPSQHRFLGTTPSRSHKHFHTA